MLKCYNWHVEHITIITSGETYRFSYALRHDDAKNMKPLPLPLPPAICVTPRFLTKSKKRFEKCFTGF